MSAYVPLPHDGEFIRLLELAPGNVDDELVGEFLVHNLKDAQPGYTATSYVCGNDNRSHHHILMSGTKLGIYKNADELLRRFRSKSHITHLWVDVVCIDQDDVVEKAREVGLMYKVYQNSKRTVIWLGPAGADATAAIQYARTLDGTKYLEEYKPTVMNAGYETQYLQNKSHILDVLQDRPQKESLINSCAEFLLRPYFTRVWTQQESALSSAPIVVCGPDEIAWNQIFALAWLFQPRYTMAWPDWFLSNYPGERYARLEPNLIFIRSIQEYRLRQMMLANGEPDTRAFTLIHAMHDASRFRCYDPRDKIYAVRNMATDLALDDWAPEPDYVTPWEDVYTDFSVRMAERGSDQMLDWSGVCQQGANSGLPSWVVDWRSHPWTQYINHSEWCAGGKTFRPKAERIPKKKQHGFVKMLQAANQPRKSLKYSLQMTVMMQDTIAYLSGVLKDWKGFDDITSLHHDVLEMDRKSREFISTLSHPTYITSEPTIDAYNTTLIANTTDQDTIASPSYISQGAKEWRSWLSSGANVKNSSMPSFHDAIDSIDLFQYKHFCVSGAGYLCLVPDITLPTDVIAIVKGLAMPIVLRPVGEHYIYLGQSYIHGMMELKAGELIEEFRIKFDVKEKKVVVHRPEGDVRRNGLKMDAGEYVRILGTLGERKVELV